MRFAPLVEPGPRAQVFAKGVEPLLDLRPNGPMAMAAVALVVNRRSLTAANALLPHAVRTARAFLRLRLAIVGAGG